MLTITHYSVEYDQKKKAYRIICTEKLHCPGCGGMMSGYDTRRRHVVDAAGHKHWLLLQRFRCINCNQLHLVAPSFIIPQKHYEASVIAEVKAGRENMCPADNSTIRRWRR